MNRIRYAAKLAWHKSGLRDIYVNLQFKKIENEWTGLIESKKFNSSLLQKNSDTLLIIPPDPKLLTSSKGDEAMLATVIEKFRTNNPSKKIAVTTCSPVADQKAIELGLIPIRALDYDYQVDAALEIISKYPINQCVVIGADVLDGSYDPRFSLRLIAIADLLARMSIRTTILGFSFSKKPYPGLSSAYSRVSKNITHYLRDPRSFDRFKSFSNANCKLSSDIAFKVPESIPSDATQKSIAWIDERVKKLQTVIGFNIHPLLLGPNEQGKIPPLHSLQSKTSHHPINSLSSY